MIPLPLRTRFLAREWYVAPTNIEAAKRLVRQYHYSRSSSPQGVYLFGLLLKGDYCNVWGVSWWIPAMQGTINRYNPGRTHTTLVLHRLVVHPLVPTNGASFLLGRSIRQIEQDGRFDMLVTYADTWRGHTGQIYKATNWNYEGLSDPMPVWVMPTGAQKSKRNGLAGKNHTTPQEMIDGGATLVGKYPKHVYTMRLRLKKQPQQLSLWEAA